MGWDIFFIIIIIQILSYYINNQSSYERKSHLQGIGK